MAGIQYNYRSFDTFRFPTWDENISYPVNSVVAQYDSDAGFWKHYIAKTPTTAGSLDSDIRFSQWTQFAFDSESLLYWANKAIVQNFSSLTAAIDSDFSATLARLDSENDSDFNVLYLKIDSDLKEFRTYVDSEIAILKAEQDSDIRVLNTTVNNYINQLNYGRFFDSEAILTETIDTRLSGIIIDAGDTRYIRGTFDDQVQDDTTITFRAYTSSVLNYSSSLYQNINGAHRIVPTLDSETIFANWSPHAYVGAFSFKGVESGLGGGYFTSAYFEWHYSDGSVAKENQHLVALDNTTRITSYNPDITKKVDYLKVTAYNKSNNAPGINYIQVSSAYAAPELRAHRANILHFQSTADMLRYEAHPDTIAVVHATKSLFVSSDSEWIASDPRFTYVDTTYSALDRNFPPGNLEDNIRAMTSVNGYEYIVRSGAWVLDVTSVEGYDSDLVHNLDSDFAVLSTRFTNYIATFEPEFWRQIEAFDDRLEQNDSEIIRLSRALNTFYKDYVAIKVEHLAHVREFDSDYLALVAKYEAFKQYVQLQLGTYVTNYNVWTTTTQANFTAQMNAALTTFTNTVNNYTQSLKEDHDSDTEVLSQGILANSIDISLLRNGPVADNDSDIRALERRFTNHDSDYNYLFTNAMKFRGEVDVTDSETYPKTIEVNDVYINTRQGKADVIWGPALGGELVPWGAMLIYTAADGWRVISSSGNSTTSTENVGVPAGTILTFTDEKAIPDSFHICDGSVFDPGLYTELYYVLGTNRVPDLRGYFLRAWSDDNTIDKSGPRAALSIQTEAVGPHTHTTQPHNHTHEDNIPTDFDGVLDGGTDTASGNNATVNRTTGSTTVIVNANSGVETRPVNIAVIYAIAMYSGAGSSRYNYDSDLRARVQENDSDIAYLKTFTDNIDGRLIAITHKSNAQDSDLSDRITDNDSDILKLQQRVNTLTGQFNLVQFNVPYLHSVEGDTVANVEYDITSYVVNTATPEPFAYPDITFFYTAAIGGTRHPTLAGRKLDGTNGTPLVSYRIIQDVVGNVTISMSSNTTIQHDMRIVSTFRTA